MGTENKLRQFSDHANHTPSGRGEGSQMQLRPLETPKLGTTRDEDDESCTLFTTNHVHYRIGFVYHMIGSVENYPPTAQPPPGCVRPAVPKLRGPADHSQPSSLPPLDPNLRHKVQGKVEDLHSHLQASWTRAGDTYTKALMDSKGKVFAEVVSVRNWAIPALKKQNNSQVGGNRKGKK